MPEESGMPLSEDYHTKLLVLKLLKTDPNKTVGHRQPEKTGLAGQLPSRWSRAEKGGRGWSWREMREIIKLNESIK